VQEPARVFLGERLRGLVLPLLCTNRSNSLMSAARFVLPGGPSFIEDLHLFCGVVANFGDVGVR
jgi:hypothetical protein